MAEFLPYCAQFSPLSQEAQAEMLHYATLRTFKKGEYLLRKTHICEYLFFINEGLLKLYFEEGSKQFVTRFFAENVLFSVFDSFTSQTPSRFSLIALEDTTVTVISYEELEELCKKHHCIETLYRKLLSLATSKMTLRICEMLEANAAERYQQFVQVHESIMQRVSLGDIANYLGITQQSLSRIRADHFLTNGKKKSPY
jgi:CRP-like cAMP-binding protein